MLFLRLLAAALALAGLRGVGIILVDDHGRFLLNRRGTEPDKRLSGRWSILSGRIQPGETPEQAALREIEEEIGHPVPRVHSVVRVSWPRPVHLYAAPLPTPADSVLLGEGMEHRLVTLDEAGQLSPRAPLLRPVLRAFAATAAYRACLRDARQT
jgi:8-oxo-dGTP pyrophosphatase MutT (NUDIX family)